MTCDSCKVKTVVVDIQENGIIRIDGRYAARLDRDIDFNDIIKSHELQELATLREQVKVLREALEGARIFIVDGLEFWCVEQPEPGKPAFDALNGIYRALAQTKPKDGK